MSEKCKSIIALLLWPERGTCVLRARSLVLLKKRAMFWKENWEFGVAWCSSTTPLLLLLLLLLQRLLLPRLLLPLLLPPPLMLLLLLLLLHSAVTVSSAAAAAHAADADAAAASVCCCCGPLTRVVLLQIKFYTCWRFVVQIRMMKSCWLKNHSLSIRTGFLLGTRYIRYKRENKK